MNTLFAIVCKILAMLGVTFGHTASPPASVSPLKATLASVRKLVDAEVAKAPLPVLEVFYDKKTGRPDKAAFLSRDGNICVGKIVNSEPDGFWLSYHGNQPFFRSAA